MSRINYPKINFDHFLLCSPDLLDEEISRMSIRMKLQQPNTPGEHDSYQAQSDKLTVVKYISRLRRGKLSREDFDLKVELTNANSLLS